MDLQPFQPREAPLQPRARSSRVNTCRVLHSAGCMLVAASCQLDTALCGLKMFTGFESGSFSTVLRCSFSAARKFQAVEPDMKAASWFMVVVTTLAKGTMLPAASCLPVRQDGSCGSIIMARHSSAFRLQGVGKVQLNVMDVIDLQCQLKILTGGNRWKHVQIHSLGSSRIIGGSHQSFIEVIQHPKYSQVLILLPPESPASEVIQRSFISRHDPLQFTLGPWYMPLPVLSHGSHGYGLAPKRPAKLCLSGAFATVATSQKVLIRKPKKANCVRCSSVQLGIVGSQKDDEIYT